MYHHYGPQTNTGSGWSRHGGWGSSWGGTHYTPAPPPDPKKVAAADEKRLEHTVLGHIGFRNLGNTCYMNSALQAFMSNPMVAAFFCDKKRWDPVLRKNVRQKLEDAERERLKLPPSAAVDVEEKNVTKERRKTVTYTLYETAKMYWEANGVLIPDTIREKIGDLDHRDPFGFMSGRQQDVDDLIRHLLLAIGDELKGEAPVPFDSIPEVDRPEVIELLRLQDAALKDPSQIPVLDKYIDEHPRALLTFQGYTAWKADVEKSHSPITQMFTGMNRISIKCHRCKRTRDRFEPFTAVAVPIPERGGGRLTECLKSVSKPEVLRGEWTCPTCETKVDMDTTTTIVDTPKFLVLQLKRFEHDFRLNKQYKLYGKISFPIEGLTLKDNSSADLDPLDDIYDLQSVIFHSGSLDGGHYYAYAKNALNGEWYRHDDTSVHHVPKDKIEEVLIDPNAYVLFYARRTRTE